MHIAILRENEDMVDYIGKGFRQTMKIGDNVSEFARRVCVSRILCVSPYPCQSSHTRGGDCYLAWVEIELMCHALFHGSCLQLERTPLHYAMGVNGVEAISRILVKNGAKRVAKDLKGRQPSYYFMNKADILRLQEEEEKWRASPTG